jgi:hypothetical protein
MWTEGYLHAKKQSGHEIDNSPSPSVEVNNVGSYIYPLLSTVTAHMGTLLHEWVVVSSGSFRFGH